MIVGKLLLQVKEFITSYRKVSLAFISSSRPANLLKEVYSEGDSLWILRDFFSERLF